MKVKVVISLFGALLIAPLASAHHNFAAHYRTEETVELLGVVTEFRFVNPHARVYVEVLNEDGEAEMWMAEGDAMVALRRSGWTADQLTPGDRIELTGNPSRSGANMIGWNPLQLADGADIGAAPPSASPSPGTLSGAGPLVSGL